MICPGFLSAAERFELEACVRRQREDHGIARRANAILLLDDGKSCQVIAEVSLSGRRYHSRLAQNLSEAGWDALRIDGWKGGSPV